jgi:hypothetical protein
MPRPYRHQGASSGEGAFSTALERRHLAGFVPVPFVAGRMPALRRMQSTIMALAATRGDERDGGTRASGSHAGVDARVPESGFDP